MEKYNNYVKQDIDVWKEGDNLNWFTIEEIDSHTYSISEYKHWEKAHSYLLIGSESALLIDTGLGIGDIKREVKGITDLPIKVVSTHFHWDHVGGHKSFNEIYVHHGDLDWFNNGLPIPLEVLKKEIIKNINLEDLPKGFDIDEYSVFRGAPSRILKDRDIIELGSRTIRVIHTPGHSPGHICLLDEECGYLFSGDLIYKGNLYVNYPSTEPVRFKESIKKIKDLCGIKRILPSHNEIDIPTEIVESILTALDDIDNKGLLKHGSGTFKYDGFSVVL